MVWVSALAVQNMMNTTTRSSYGSSDGSYAGTWIPSKGPPQILVDTFPVTSHLVVDKDENAVIVVLFCSDPEPRQTFWEWETFRQETNSNTGRHTADEIQRVSYDLF
ncbi:i-set domain-containing protein [Trichonephila clavipes]|nr:i-set domain-containing protein [Trichonephila clavipes]